MKKLHSVRKRGLELYEIQTSKIIFEHNNWKEF